MFVARRDPDVNLNPDRMTVAELRGVLLRKAIEPPAGAKKPQLVKMFRDWAQSAK